MYDALIKSVEDNKLTNTHAVLSFIHVFSRRFEKKKKLETNLSTPISLDILKDFMYELTRLNFGCF